MENYYVPNPNSSSPSPSMISNFLGCRFVPNDDELIHHLGHKKAYPTDYTYYPMITDFNVYQDEPACLPWDLSTNSMFRKDERFFFVQREPGRKVARTVSSGKGWWNTNSEKAIYNDQKQLIGFDTSLTYFEVKEAEETVNENRKRKERNSEEEPKKSRKDKGIKTDWLMHEYVCDKSKDQDWVLCKIYYNNKKNAAPLIAFPAASQPLIEEGSMLTCLSNGGEEEEEPNNSKRLKTTGVVEESGGYVAAAAAAREDDLGDILNNLEQILEFDDDDDLGSSSAAEEWDVFGLVDLLKKPLGG